jgi:hypothetical protein
VSTERPQQCWRDDFANFTPPDTPAGIARIIATIERLEAEHGRMAAAGRPTAVIEALIESKRRSLAALEAVHDQLSAVVRRTKNGAIGGVPATAPDTTRRNPLARRADLSPPKRESEESEARCRPPT